MKEQNVQTKIKKKLTEQGWLVVKLMKTSLNGIPDLMCLKNGKAMFIEVKTDKGIVSPLQNERIECLRRQGFEVKIWKDYETDL